MKEGRPDAWRRCQRMSSQTRPARAAVRSCWCTQGPAAPSLSPVVHWAPPGPPCPPRLPCHSGSPRTMTEHLDDVPGTRFFRLPYIKDPAWKPRPRFFGEKTASTALTAIAGCRGGYREKQASRVAGATSCTMRLSGPGGVRHAVVIGSKALAAAARAERWRCFHRPAVVGW
jgi:hypothetical protein